MLDRVMEELNEGPAGLSRDTITGSVERLFSFDS